VDQPLAPVDILDFDFGEDLAPELEPAPEPSAPPTPMMAAVDGAFKHRPPTRFGAGAASEMPAPPVPPISNIKPAYGLVGVPDEAVTTRDVKTFALGAALGALVATVFSWMGRRSRGM
jgi:hypothetical protein